MGQSIVWVILNYGLQYPDGSIGVSRTNLQLRTKNQAFIVVRISLQDFLVHFSGLVQSIGVDKKFGIRFFHLQIFGVGLIQRLIFGRGFVQFVGSQIEVTEQSITARCVGKILLGLF